MLVYLSFADPDRPKGTQWLGASIVSVDSEMEAIAASWLFGCNPGGEVVFQAFPEEIVPKVPQRFLNRLLSLEDVQEMDTVILRGEA